MNFKDHFSGHANIYHEARPTYSAELFDWLAKQTPARDLAWDAGGGNGQASIALPESSGRGRPLPNGLHPTISENHNV